MLYTTKYLLSNLPPHVYCHMIFIWWCYLRRYNRRVNSWQYFLPRDTVVDQTRLHVSWLIVQNSDWSDWTHPNIGQIFWEQESHDRIFLINFCLCDCYDLNFSKILWNHCFSLCSNICETFWSNSYVCIPTFVLLKLMPKMNWNPSIHLWLVRYYL